MGVMADFHFSFWWKSWSCLCCQGTNRTGLPLHSRHSWTESVRLTVLTYFVQLQHVSYPRNLRGREIHPFKKKLSGWDFPSGPMANTPCSQSRGPGFDSWSGNDIPYSATKTWCSQRNKPSTWFKKLIKMHKRVQSQSPSHYQGKATRDPGYLSPPLWSTPCVRSWAVPLSA